MKQFVRNKEIEKRSIKKDATILDALKKMDQIDKKLLIILNNDTFIGLISIGDIQRAIIRNVPLESKISKIIRQEIKVAKTTDSIDEIKEYILKNRVECMPVVNNDGLLTNVHFWEDFVQQPYSSKTKQLDNPVVIMAGGQGTRLRPLTYVLPKPLIPIGKQTMLEKIIQKFDGHGCKNFYISVNYKADLIKYYMASLSLKVNIEYFQETQPLGTAGSLSLLKGIIKETFFVNNCDIIINQDYNDLLDYHLSNQNIITIVAAIKSYSIPYGTLETSESGLLETLKEKPEITFMINTGMYIIEPVVLDEINENEFLHITDLIYRIKAKGHNVGVFPVSEGSWQDIGEAHLLKRYFDENGD